jgi:hypothetical protein
LHSPCLNIWLYTNHMGYLLRLLRSITTLASSLNRSTCRSSWSMAVNRVMQWWAYFPHRNLKERREWDQTRGSSHLAVHNNQLQTSIFRGKPYVLMYLGQTNNSLLYSRRQCMSNSKWNILSTTAQAAENHHRWCNRSKIPWTHLRDGHPHLTTLRSQRSRRIWLSNQRRITISSSRTTVIKKSQTTN